jgi:hypothetical protein
MPRKFGIHFPIGTPCNLGKVVVLGEARKMEKLHKDNIISTLRTQGTNNNKSEEMEKMWILCQKAL